MFSLGEIRLALLVFSALRTGPLNTIATGRDLSVHVKCLGSCFDDS